VLIGGPSDSPLIQLGNSTFTGRDDQSGGTFFSLTDRDSSRPSELTAASIATLQSPFLGVSNSAISSLFSLLSTTRSTFLDTHTAPLIQLSNSTVSLGGTDPFNPGTPTYAALLLVQGFRTDGSVAPPQFDGTAFLGGPLLRATGSHLDMTADVIG